MGIRTYVSKFQVNNSILILEWLRYVTIKLAGMFYRCKEIFVVSSDQNVKSVDDFFVDGVLYQLLGTSILFKVQFNRGFCGIFN